MLKELTWQDLIKEKNILFYGAGNIAETVMVFFKKLFPMLDVTAVFVSEKKNNPQSINGIPVLSIDKATRKFCERIVVVAVKDCFYEDIYNCLDSHGFTRVCSFTFESSNWEEIRQLYLRQLYLKEGTIYYNYTDLPLNINEAVTDFCFYEVISHMDKKLCQSINPDFSKYLTPIQVGKECTEKNISEVKDDFGDNISKSNPSFCELTGIYWIWKHDKSLWKGICHYRRHFCLTLDDCNKLNSLPVDVILTVPILCNPTVSAVYKRDHEKKDWDAMMYVLSHLEPQYYQTALDTFNGCYYYGYNMLLAKKEVFDAYCEWLFPLLFAIEKRCANREDIYQKRYIGFLAERLTSLYFVHNRHSLRIAHARKEFYR